MSKDNSVKITVAIPTYNDSKYIAEALDSVISQLEDKNNKIEILVSDNASTDKTPEIVKEYQNRYPDLISYYRNQENLGFDRNVDLLFKRAKGEYLWLLSDDDAIEDNSLVYVGNIIFRYPNLSVVFVRCRHYDIELKKVLFNRGWGCEKDIYCRNGDEFFQGNRFTCGTMSSLIIKKDLWNSVDLREFIGSGWIHFAAIIVMLLDKESYIIGSRPSVKQRDNWKLKDNSCRVLRLGFILVELFKKMKALGYKKETYSIGINMMKSSNLRSIIRANAAGIKGKTVIAKRMVNCYKQYISLWLLDLPVLFAPNIFSKLIMKIYRIYKGCIRKK